MQQVEPIKPDMAELLPLARELQLQLRDYPGASCRGGRYLEPQPWTVSAADWALLEAGIRQRQRLLARVLADLYGPQQLLRDQLLPAALLARCPAFMLPLVGLPLSEADWLPLLSAEVTPDGRGQWFVWQDYGVPPAGLGLLLEHRLAFNQCAALLPQAPERRQLAGFFRSVRQALQPGADHAPALSALLVPAGRGADYFEQAFLANYLDVALVQAPDLLYRDGQLHLKTVNGLQAVSALVRCLPAAQTDPLELSDGQSGCAGFVQALRQQQLRCLNPPGTELLDSAVLMPYLPALCQALLGEALLLPQAQALWLGDPNMAALFWQDPQHYRLRRLSGGPWLSAEPRRLAELQQEPAQWLAVQLLTLPATQLLSANGAWSAQYGSIRLYALADKVLPGGYGWFAADSQQLQCQPGSRGALVRDVWVAGEKEPDQSLLASTSVLSLSRYAGLVPSRLADHLFWLGRYHERLNQLCRALRAALQLQLQQHDSGAEQAALLRYALAANGVETGISGLSASLQHLFATETAGGIHQLLQALLFNAESAREYFASDSWALLDRLQQLVRQWPAPAHQPAPRLTWLRLLDELVMLQMAFDGLIHETMSRTQGLRMLELGQHLERGLQTALLLQHCLLDQAGAGSALLLETLLRQADTLMTYRRRYRSQLHALAVLDLLIFDDSTPRSVSYQCGQIQQQCQLLPQLHSGPGLSPLQRAALELQTLLQLTDVQTLFDDDTCATPALGLLLSQLQHRFRQLSDQLSQAYFHHVPKEASWHRL